jgi:hypothetical protein
VLETDNTNLQQLLTETEIAIFLRIQELRDRPSTDPELQDITAAEVALTTLRAERLGLDLE